MPAREPYPTDRPLTDQIALITGAGRGIGRAIAEKFARAGAPVILAARSGHELDECTTAIRTAGGEALAVPTDLVLADQVDALAATTLDRYGRIDILVNNAGYGPPRSPIVKSRSTDWQRLVQVNLLAAMTLTKCALPGMIERRRGAVVMLGSSAGLVGGAGEAAYAASKFGLRGFTQALFAEVRRYGIKVSYLCPGYVDTALLPPNNRLDRGALLRPADVAEAAYQIVTSPPHSCPVEVVLEPQRDPFR